MELAIELLGDEKEERKGWELHSGTRIPESSGFCSVAGIVGRYDVRLCMCVVISASYEDLLRCPHCVGINRERIA